MRQLLYIYLGLEKDLKNVNNMINYKFKFFVNLNCKKKKLLRNIIIRLQKLCLI